jgi:hypothetical protein
MFHCPAGRHLWFSAQDKIHFPLHSTDLFRVADYPIRCGCVIAQITCSLSQNHTINSERFIFSSELSMALYLLPAVFAGIGVNLLSHVLIGHLNEAEQKFDQEHRHP